MRKKYIIFLIVFLVAWGLSILKCEVLTYQYGSQFKENYKENTMIGDIDYLKILNYTNNNAQVYYVSSEHSGGDILKFYKDKGNWYCYSWDTVWSASGSADGVVWPYWWHFFYAH